MRASPCLRSRALRTGANRSFLVLDTTPEPYRNQVRPESDELRLSRVLRSSNAGSWIRPRNTPAQGSKTGPISARGGRYYPRLDAYAALWMLSRPLLLPPLVHPHPASGLHQRGLYRSVCILQAVPERSVLGACEPVSRVALQGGDLPGHAREVAGSMSLLPSFGSCGPIYDHLILRPEPVK